MLVTTPNLYRLFVVVYLLNLPLIFFTHIIDPKLWVTDLEAKAVLGSILYDTIYGSGPERTQPLCFRLMDTTSLSV